ncbi:MAG TPA: hypothetical protein VGW80_12985 [Solirubrobacterales bacterium]|jgi:hypothetical protein|nr:hypothetical protein [Solirubrobacterales bacterium]
MRSWVVKIGLLALVVGALSAAPAQAGEVVFAPQDNAHPTANDGWQAGTCKTDVPECSVETPGQFYERAAGHPPVGFTQFIVKHTSSLGHEEPEVDMKDLRVDLPVGLSVNPGAVPRCGAEHPKECATAQPLSRVGESRVYVSPEAPVGAPIEIKAQVYNLVPKQGQPARFGFTVEAIPGFPLIPPSDIYLEADVAWESDFHEGFTIAVPKNTGVRLLKNRLVFNGEAHAPGGQGFFITTPSTCWNPITDAAHKHTYSTYARADSYQNPDPIFPNGSPFVESPIPPGTFPKECASIPFKPTIGVNPGTNAVDSPADAVTEVKVPIEENPKGQETSTVRTAKVTLPQGMGLNPSAAAGLAACTEAQFAKGTRNPVSCPPASKIGTATVISEALPDEPLTGEVYVAEQKSRDPESGKEFRIFVHAKSDRYGVDVRLIGEVIANAKTGQLTAYFDDPAKNVLRGAHYEVAPKFSDNIPHGLPQVPFTNFKISITGGQKAALSSPPTCGPHKTTSDITPWSAEFGGKSASPSSEFALGKLPGGADCPKTMAERPFAPGFTAEPKSDEAKAFTPFSTHISRPAGQQELKGLDITLPPGATAKLAGVQYCPEAAIAAASARAGNEEKSNPSCPDDSKIGVATVEAGTGDSPLKIEGTAYLAGPSEGAQLSVVVITPAIAGPFDLGNVVVRVPLFVDPETAQVHTKTDALPDVYGGTKLDIRSVFLNLNRKEFTLNGTNCNKGATAGVIKGGGADPTNPAAYSAFAVSDEFQAKNCDRLGFKPKLKIRLFGKTKRAKHPKLRAILTARPDDANIARAAVALPHALFLDQASLGTVCTRVQFAASQCPKKSIYGRARAFTPLLAKPLEGPVYLRSSNNTLPDMVAHLQGQVDIDLVGRIDSFKGGIRTTFDRVPDVPVTKFVMTLPGGKKGLLVNSRSLCAKPVKGIIRIKGQNGKKANSKPKLRTPCKKKKHGKKHKKKH